MKLPEGVLPFRLLKERNLSLDTEKVARATIKTFTYKDMSTQLKTIFGDQQTISNISKNMQGMLKLPSEVKTEPTYFETEEEQADLYSYENSRRVHSSLTNKQQQEAYQ